MSENETLNRAIGWALLTAPLRIVLAILVFAPVSLALKATTKIGELLAEIGAYFDLLWNNLMKDTSFLLHGKSLEQARKNAEELKCLREKIKRLKEVEEIRVKLEQLKEGAK